jgi:hypothetical protein
MMSSKTTTTAVATLLASTFLTCAPASATVIIGTDNDGVNYIPFGTSISLPEYQQVYASSDFSGAITIDDIEFYTSGSTGALPTGKIDITLSTTSAAVNGLSVNLSQNYGSSKTSVYSATLPAVVSGVLTIPLSKPFTYNPAKGNLLIDIDDPSDSAGSAGFEFDNPSGGLFSRASSDMTYSVDKQLGPRDRLHHRRSRTFDLGDDGSRLRRPRFRRLPGCAPRRGLGLTKPRKF